MNTKHTPGPWIAECVGAGGDYKNPIDVYEVTNGYTRIAENLYDRDARLIAAAPDLLAALQWLHHRPGTWRTPDEATAQWIEEAISKATGEDK